MLEIGIGTGLQAGYPVKLGLLGLWMAAHWLLPLGQKLQLPLRLKLPERWKGREVYSRLQASKQSSNRWLTPLDEGHVQKINLTSVSATSNPADKMRILLPSVFSSEALPLST